MPAGRPQIDTAKQFTLARVETDVDVSKCINALSKYFSAISILLPFLNFILFLERDKGPVVIVYR